MIGSNGAHFIALRTAEGGKVKAGGVGEPVECNVSPAGLQGVPHGLLAKVFEQEVGADVAEAVFITVELDFKKPIAHLGLLGQ